MKLCKDCKNYVKNEHDEKFDKCDHYGEISPIRGTQILKYCDMMRDKSYGKCGEEAKFYVSAV